MAEQRRSVNPAFLRSHLPVAFPRDVLIWLANLPTDHEDARRSFVHAGFRPGRTGIDPDPWNHHWIRKPFFGSAFDFSKYVVHGYTPQMEVRADRWSYRINLDTACRYRESLTAGIIYEIQAPPNDFLQVDSDR